MHYFYLEINAKIEAIIFYEEYFKITQLLKIN